MRMEIVFKDGRKKNLEEVESFNVAEEKLTNEGKLFEVDPLKIDRSIFEQKMSDYKQEETRMIIQEAFEEVDKHPQKYAVRYYTMVPEKTWEGYKTSMELEEYAKDFGGNMADWVEQALEWAQRISNGESWKALCNDADTEKWHRMIIWKNGYKRVIGGSRGSSYNFSASTVTLNDYKPDQCACFTVPLVVIKRK